MIPLMKSAFLKEHETKQALSEFIVRTSRLSMGAQCARFENEFSNFQLRKHSILFNSGGSANLAIIQALKNTGRLHDGDMIGFSALTWSTNVMPIIQLGCIPVPVDCNPRTLNVMSDNLLDCTKKFNLKAMFITNALGFTGDLKRIQDICEDQGILLIEDNCEALGTELTEKKAGNFGKLASFSFFVAHHMSTIEGGMVCTDDDELSEMLKIVRANGWDRNIDSEAQFKWRSKHNVISEFFAKYTFYDLGYNLRPTEITGFLGSFQLPLLEGNIQKREQNYLRLESESKKNPDLYILDHSHISKLSSFAYPVVCNSKELREKYIYQFSGAGVEVRPMISGNMQKQPFYSKYCKIDSPLPGAQIIHDCGFYCGNYPELDEMDLETLASCLKKYN